MFCNKCQRLVEAQDGVCPHCGEAKPALRSGVMKSSTILISAGQTDAVYRSVNEIPGALRKKLLKSTSGLNGATILIADRRGREELAKAIRRLPSLAQRKLLKAVLGEEDGENSAIRGASRQKVVFVLLLLATALMIWMVYTWRW